MFSESTLLGTWQATKKNANPLLISRAMGSRCAYLRLTAMGVLIFAQSVGVLAEQNWKAIDPSEIALNAPKVDKDADAEAIFWEIEVEDHEDHAILSHYIRIKIFGERGRDSQSKVDLSFGGKNKIEDISGRTVKADGTVLDLNASSVFERTLARAKGLKVQAKSFVL